jgi:hypothetical protein
VTPHFTEGVLEEADGPASLGIEPAAEQS